MKKIIKYKLITASNRETLNKYVQDHLEKDWQPYGSPMMAINSYNSNEYCQAVAFWA